MLLTDAGSDPSKTLAIPTVSVFATSETRRFLSAVFTLSLNTARTTVLCIPVLSVFGDKLFTTKISSVHRSRSLPGETQNPKQSKVPPSDPSPNPTSSSNTPDATPNLFKIKLAMAQEDIIIARPIVALTSIFFAVAIFVSSPADDIHTTPAYIISPTAITPRSPKNIFIILATIPIIPPSPPPESAVVSPNVSTPSTSSP